MSTEHLSVMSGANQMNQDDRKVAEETASRYIGSGDAIEYRRTKIAKAIIIALTAARDERRAVDAKIAEDYRLDPRYGDHYVNGATMAAQFIAAAIRGAGKG